MGEEAEAEEDGEDEGVEPREDHRGGGDAENGEVAGRVGGVGPELGLAGEEDGEKDEGNGEDDLHATEEDVEAVDGGVGSQGGGGQEGEVGEEEEAAGEQVGAEGGEEGDEGDEAEDESRGGRDGAGAGEEEKPERVVAVGGDEAVEGRALAVGEVVGDLEVVEEVVFEEEHPGGLGEEGAEDGDGGGEDEDEGGEAGEPELEGRRVGGAARGHVGDFTFGLRWDGAGVGARYPPLVGLRTFGLLRVACLRAGAVVMLRIWQRMTRWERAIVTANAKTEADPPPCGEG